jgi:hypothetical protein
MFASPWLAVIHGDSKKPMLAAPSAEPVRPGWVTACGCFPLLLIF